MAATTHTAAATPRGDRHTGLRCLLMVRRSVELVDSILADPPRVHPGAPDDVWSTERAAYVLLADGGVRGSRFGSHLRAPVRGGGRCLSPVGRSARRVDRSHQLRRRRVTRD